MGQTNGNTVAGMMALGGVALFGLIDNFMRLAAAEGGLWQFHFLRGLLAVALILPAAAIWGMRLRPVRIGAVAARSLFNSLAMVLYFGGLGFMPIAQVLAGLFTAPLFVVLFSVLFFGERIGPRRAGAAALGFVGVLLTLRPEAGAIGWGTILPLASGACYGMANLLTRRWCEAEGTATLLVWFFGTMVLWGALGCLVLWLWPLPVAEGAAGWATRGWVLPQGWFLAIVLVQAVGSLVGVGLVIRAYQLAEDPTLIAVFENALLVFATLWAIVLWNESPDLRGWIGLGLITLAGIVIAVRSR